jgi:predicted nucleic acid-binding protein
MDFADASLVIAAEILAVRKILTFDAHFYAYRIHDRFTFEVLP